MSKVKAIHLFLPLFHSAFPQEVENYCYWTIMKMIRTVCTASFCITSQKDFSGIIYFILSKLLSILLLGSRRLPFKFNQQLFLLM